MEQNILTMSKLNYQDVYVVETFEEAEEFRYEHDNQTVEVGTAVAFERDYQGVPGKPGPIEPTRQLVCFEGIYFEPTQ